MKPHPVQTSLLVVYLLHFDQRHGTERHYVGITTPPRLLDRMREHCSGRAAARTSRAVAAGEPWSLANIWTTGWRGLESHMAHVADFWWYCPVCRGRPGLKRFNENKKAASTPLAASELLDLSSRTALAGGSLPGHEKGEEPKLPPPFLSFGQS